MNKVLLVIVVILIGIGACKKEKPPVAEEKVKPADTIPILPDYEMMHITKPLWIIYKLESGGVNIWSIPGIIDNCLKDDTYRFTKDSVLTDYENKVHCAGTTDSTKSKWQFIDNRKRVLADLFGMSDTADIKSLTDTTMQLFINYSGQDADVYFKKK